MSPVGAREVAHVPEAEAARDLGDGSVGIGVEKGELKDLPFDPLEYVEELDRLPFDPAMDPGLGG